MNFSQFQAFNTQKMNIRPCFKVGSAFDQQYLDKYVQTNVNTVDFNHNGASGLPTTVTQPE